MPRIRTIKPEFWTDGDMLKISRDARLFYIGLWNFADDNGVVEGDPMSLKARVFPCDQIDITGLIKELETVGKVFLYSSQNSNLKPWILIKSFNSHQLIDRPRKSNNPMPSEEQMKSVGYQMTSHDIIPGREGKGRKGRIVRPQEELNEIVEEWNNLMPWKVKTLTNERKYNLSARLGESGFKENFTIIINKIIRSDFASGRTPSKDHPNWRADFDFVIKDDKNWVKILEGRYDRRTPARRAT